MVIGQDASADTQHHRPVSLYQNLKRRLAVVGDKTFQEDPIVLSAQGTHLLKCSHAAKHNAELAVRHETLRNWFPVHPLKCSEQRNGYTIFSSSREMQHIEAKLSGEKGTACGRKRRVRKPISETDLPVEPFRGIGFSFVSSLLPHES